VNDPSERFGVYLEAAGAGERARRFRESAGEAAVEAARGEWSGGLLSPSSTAETVVERLGEPVERTTDTLAYLLPQRPTYLYTFRFVVGTGRLATSFFRRRAVAPPLPIFDASIDAKSLARSLAEIGATSEEIRAAFGEPLEIDGWWPHETWTYPSGLLLNLRHGVVEED
jgi:hypothetical protein